jgi:arginase
VPKPDAEVHVLGVPLDHGAGRRGVGMGPAAVRIARLLESLERVGVRATDRGDVEVRGPETEEVGAENARYLGVVSRACADLAARVEEIIDEGNLPLVIGGDHSIALGTISGVSAALREEGASEPPEFGVLWFDAHADINTPETSPTGNIHGMPVALLLGKGPEELTSVAYAGPKLRPSRLVQIGLRDLDHEEKRRLRTSEIHTFTMDDIDRRGMATVMEEAIRLACDGVDFLHVSFDIDVLDPTVAPGTGTQKKGGLTYREAHLALEMVAETERLRSFELVEVNPVLDRENMTARLAVDLICSAMGKRIL